MSVTPFTDSEIIDGISAAIAARDMPATANLMRLLALQAPAQAQLLYDAIVHRKITVTIPPGALDVPAREAIRPRVDLGRLRREAAARAYWRPNERTQR